MSFTPLPQQITSITQANPAVVTTLSNHNLTTGQIIRINIPAGYGMQQLNKQTASITVLSANTFSLQYSQTPPAVNIDSRIFDPFINLSTGTPAQMIPVGSGPTPITNTIPQMINNECESLIGDALANISTVEIPF